jgi:hypothetical protein
MIVLRAESMLYKNDSNMWRSLLFLKSGLKGRPSRGMKSFSVMASHAIRNYRLKPVRLIDLNPGASGHEYASRPSPKTGGTHQGFLLRAGRSRDHPEDDRPQLWDDNLVALKRFGLKRRQIKRPCKKGNPELEPEDPNTPENIQMLKTKRCKGINGLPCTGKIRIDKTGVEGLACWLAICH